MMLDCTALYLRSVTAFSVGIIFYVLVFSLQFPLEIFKMECWFLLRRPIVLLHATFHARRFGGRCLYLELSLLFTAGLFALRRLKHILYSYYRYRYLCQTVFFNVMRRVANYWKTEFLQLQELLDTSQIFQEYNFIFPHMSSPIKGTAF